MMVRRRIAAGIGVVALIVIVLLINGCLKSGKEEALKKYNHEVGQLVGESDQQVAHPLFAGLAGASSEPPLNVEQKVNELREVAQRQAEQAKRMSVPGEMEAAQRNFTLVFDLREEALAKIAPLVREALGGKGKQASASIAGAMEMFLASDVIYSQRVAPLIQQELAAGAVHGLSTASTEFLANLGWLEPSTVEERLTGKSSTAAQSGQIAPGTHGSALKGVSVGPTNLEPESTGTVNHLNGGSSPTFKVMVEDSGSNSETGLKVEVTVTAGGRQYKDQPHDRQNRTGGDLDGEHSRGRGAGGRRGAGGGVCPARSGGDQPRKQQGLLPGGVQRIEATPAAAACPQGQHQCALPPLAR